MQKYIKPKGPLATKVRTIYNKNKSVPFTNYVFTNRQAMFEPLLTNFGKESMNHVREELNQAFLIDS
jgi:hypothetical protein